MLTAVVTSSASTVQLTFQGGVLQSAEEEEHAEAEVPEKDLNPIFPEVKEVVWGFGSFVVLALAMRLFLFRKVRDGMTARYDKIEGDFQEAQDITAAARADVADYDAQVAAARAEAQQQVEAARAILEAERAARLTEVNAAHRRQACRCRRRRRRGQARRPLARRVGRRRRRLVRRPTGDRQDAVTRRRERRGRRSDGGVGMSLLATASVLAGHVLQGAEEHDVPFDDQGYITEHPIFPPFTEMLISAAASIIVFVLLYKYAGPIIRKSFADRTAGVQTRLDDSAAAKIAADTEAARIREAQGDIESERARLHAEAETQAAALLVDGRARLDVEMAELEARAETDIAAAAGRSSDELRAEIARHSSVAIDRIVDETLDDATHQALIEGFIQRVGASTGASA